MAKTKYNQIDNIAYELYVNENKQHFRLMRTSWYLHKYQFIMFKYDVYVHYYKSANIILRKQKLEQINKIS